MIEKLSAIRAFLGLFHPNIISASCKINDREIIIELFIDGEHDHIKDIADEATTEILSDFPDRTVNYTIKHLENSKEIRQYINAIDSFYVRYNEI